MSPYYHWYFVVQFLLALLAAIVSAILAYGAIAATIIDCSADLHPVSRLRQARLAVLGMAQGVFSDSAFYKVIAAATMNVLSHVLTNYYIQLGQSISDPSTIVQTASSDPSRPGQRLHPLQDSIHVAQLIRGRRWGHGGLTAALMGARAIL